MVLLLVVHKWDALLKAKKDPLSTIPIQVEMHDIHYTLWTLEGLIFLASGIGKPIHFYKMTELSICNNPHYLYTRVCVEIEYDYELPSSLALDIEVFW